MNEWISQKSKIQDGKLQKSSQIVLFFTFFLLGIFCFTAYLLFVFQSQWQFLPILGMLVLLLYGYFIWQMQIQMQMQKKQLLSQQEQTHLILNTIDNGLFLLNQKLQLSEQHSSCLSDLLNQKKLGGENFLDVLKPLVSAADINIIQSFLKKLFDASVSDRLLQELNPLSQIDLTLNLDDGQNNFQRSLSFNLTRIYEKNTITHVLVGITDMTHTLQQQKVMNRADLQTQCLLSLLNMDQAHIEHFIAQTSSEIGFITTILNIENEIVDRYRKSLVPLSKHAYQLQSIAKTYHLNLFIELMDEFEEYLNQLKQQHYLSQDDFQPLNLLVQQLQQSLYMVKQVQQRLSSHHESSPIKHHFEEINEEFGIDFEEEDFTLRWHFDLHNLAKSQKKSIRLICNTTDFQNLPLQLTYKLQEYTWYLIANAAIYGIETIQDREEKGKDLQGIITVNLEDLGDEYLLTVEDDGCGIDYEFLIRHAIKLGWISEDDTELPSKEQLIEYLFEPEFNRLNIPMAEFESNTGLYWIRKWLMGKGGSIKFETESHRYTRCIIRIPK